MPAVAASGCGPMRPTPAHAAPAPSTWTPDNGNGTFTKHGGFRMPAARADRIDDGPYEVNLSISQDVDFGALPTHRFGREGQRFTIGAPQPTAKNVATLHQGRIMLTPAGECWGFSTTDANAVGACWAFSRSRGRAVGRGLACRAPVQGKS